jgi:NAD(P)-dependent dehydrogenase (short-subunit alcohol dehydrogenase family)
VTGAARGIGRATCLRLLGEGHTVYGGDIDRAGLDDLAGQGLRPLALDVTREDDCRRAVSAIVGAEGRIDAVVANAGYCSIGLFEPVPLNEARLQFEVNVFGLAATVRAALPYMRAAAEGGRGRIVLVSSAAGKVSMPGLGWYAASKFAVEALADALRGEMTSLFPGIKIALVEPGKTRTDVARASEASWEAAASEVPEYHAAMARLLANFRRGLAAGSDPDMVARMVARAIGDRVPARRYRAQRDARRLVAAARLIGGTGLFDRLLARQLLGDAKRRR